MTADRLPRNLRRRAATERVVGWSWPPAPVLDARRCWCGRPIPEDSISTCGCCCTEHDHPTEAIPARFDERYDPSPEPIDRSIQ